jgi:hypothetical protein
MCDNYIKNQLIKITGLDRKTINNNPELIEIKRVQTKLKRLANGKRNRSSQQAS